MVSVSTCVRCRLRVFAYSCLTGPTSVSAFACRLTQTPTNMDDVKIRQMSWGDQCEAASCMFRYMCGGDCLRV